MQMGVEGLGIGWGLRMEMGTEMEEGAVNRKDQNYLGMFDASEMHSSEVILSFPCSWACCQSNHTHPRSMVASPLRKPPLVVTQFSQTQFMIPKHVMKSNVNLSCLWKPVLGLAVVVGCDWEGKRGGHGCGGPLSLASLCNGERLGEVGRSGSQ